MYAKKILKRPQIELRNTMLCMEKGDKSAILVILYKACSASVRTENLVLQLRN